MNKTIGSQPGAKVFRSNSVVILVSVCVVMFLVFVDGLEKDVEVAAVKKTISEINASLAITLYQYVIKGQLDDLPKFDKQNPFIFLSINGTLPDNYRGTVRGEAAELINRSWYFNLDTNEVMYYSLDNPRVFELRFTYTDKNNDGVYEYRADGLGGLFLAEK